MLNLNNLSSIGSLGKNSGKPWFKESALKLNGVLPTLAYQFDTNRYYRSDVGASGFPFAGIRTTNATQFDSQGRMVWAPANMIAQSSVAGAVLGVVGSGGSVPTNWQVSSVAGISHTIVGIGSDYIDLRISGTNSSGSIGYPHIYFNSLATAIVNQSYTFAANVQLVAGSGANFSSFGRLTTQFFNGSTYLNEASNSNAPTSVMTRLVSTGPATNATTNNFRPNMSFSIPIGLAVDITLRISRPQSEYTGIDSPKPYNFTNGTAYYGPRFDYNPVTNGLAGLLVEIASTNLILRSHSYTTGWNLVNCSLSTLTADPMGTTLARTILDGAVLATSFSNPVVTTVASTSYTASVHLKRGNTDWVRVQVLDTTGADGFQCWINLATGATSGQSAVGVGTYTASSIGVIPLPNGWYRLSIAGTVGAGTTMSIQTMTASAASSATNVSGGTYQIFGHQLETLIGFNGCTSYIPTYEASASRAADIATHTVGSWYKATDGVFFARMYRTYDAANHAAQPFTISDGGLNNRMQVQGISALSMVHRSGGVNYDYAGATGIQAFGFIQKLAMRYTALGASFVGGGGAVITNATAVPPVTPNIMRYGGNFAGATGKAWITEVRFYPSGAASDAQLQAITA